MKALLLVASAALYFTACERRVVVIERAPATPLPEPVAETSTRETARLAAAVDDFSREPTAANRAAVKKALAQLDGEIAELEALVARRTGESREEAAAKRRNLEAYRTAQSARFAAAQAGAPLETGAARDGRTGAEKVEEGARKVEKSLEKAADRVSDAIKDATR